MSKRLYFDRPRYEVQVRSSYGWTAAGNFPARTKAEAMKALTDCAHGIRGYGKPAGSTHDYRLVRLKPIVLAVRPATLRFNTRTQTYVSLKGKR